jgi:hypothetical protein
MNLNNLLNDVDEDMIKKMMEDLDSDDLINRLNKQAEEMVKKNWDGSFGVRMSFLGMLQHKLIGKIEEFVHSDDDMELLHQIKDLLELVKLFRDDLL